MSNVVWINSEDAWRRAAGSTLSRVRSMAEVVFERELERMFAEALAFADADYFAARVEQRLDRRWTARQVLIGGLGMVGGVIGGGQLFGTGLGARPGGVPPGPGQVGTPGLPGVSPAALTRGQPRPRGGGG